MRNWLHYAPAGTALVQGYAKWSEEEGRDRVATVLKTHGVDRIVVGHTVMLISVSACGLAAASS